MIELLSRLGYYPRFCVWELTLACNLRCLHCGSFAGDRRADELTHEESQRVADELAAMRCEKLTLGGGEPTMHPHWHDLGKRLTDQGVRVNMITNGWHWTDQHVEQVKAAGLQNVGFSLDGLEPAHDQVRREGSFRRVMEALERCARAGVETSVVTHINRLNAHSLREVRQLLRDAGVGSWQLQPGNPSGVMGEHRELVIAPGDLLWLVPEIAAMRTDGNDPPAIHPADNVGYYGIHEKALRDRGAKVDFWIGCRAGCQVIGIESNGNVKGCLSLPSARHGKDVFLEGNLREHSLQEIWTRQGAFAYNREFKVEQLAGFCAVCRYRDICRGGCSWTAYSHTQSRFDNPYCFYRQAVLHKRLDLLGEDEPNAAELAAADAGGSGPVTSLHG
jgi:radical SAM protein with 4Fe4S-binding SPASM domain